MSKLYDSVIYNDLKFEYASENKDVSFYEFMASKELLNNAIKNNQIRFSKVKNKQNEFLDKPCKIKIGKKNTEQKKVINIEKFYISREEFTNFLRDFIEMLSDANYDAKQN